MMVRAAAAPPLGAEPTVGPSDVFTDRVTLTGIAATGRHGFFAFEREAGQRFVVDVSCAVDLRAAAAEDDLASTVDYGTLSQAIVADIEGEPLNLIEALADRIARTCLNVPLVHSVEVTVHKPQAPISVEFADVAVTLTRHRQDEPTR